MTSPRQIAADHQNALRFTGRKSREGKTRSSQNALRHDRTSEAVLPDEDQEVSRRCVSRSMRRSRR